MMAQYLEIKQNAQDALLFYRMGDFYELFFEDAVKASQALDIALTKRGKHLGDDIPMCGVPVATAQVYLKRLIDKEFSVAVCEQTEDPAEAKKRGSKSVVRREIVRIITKGTITEEDLLDPRSPAYIAAIAPDKAGKRAGMAWADVSTGAFFVAEMEIARLGDVVCGAAPKEILAPDGWAFEAGGVDVASGDFAGAVVTPWPGQKFNPKSGERLLCGTFGVDTLDGFGGLSTLEAGAAGALVDYLMLTQAGGQVQLAAPQRPFGGLGMAIDPATRGSLEIDRTLGGHKAGSLLHAIDRTVTAPGARMLADWMARPLTDLPAICARQDGMAYFGCDRVMTDRVRQALRRGADPARALSRILLGRGGPRDVVQLASALRAGGDAAQVVLSAAQADLAGDVERDVPDLVAEACGRLDVSAHQALADLVGEVQAVFVDSPPVSAIDGGFVRPGADGDLDAALGLRDDSRKIVASMEGQLREETGVAALKIKHNNILGYFIEVPARYGEDLRGDAANNGFIHRQTMANAVRFSTVALNDLQARIGEAAQEALARELAIFEGFCARIGVLAEDIRAAGQALALLDVVSSGALWAREVGGVRPLVDMSHVFDVEAGRHPVVEAAVRRAGNTFTPNGCLLDADGDAGARLTLITGPNMAGKSTYLRQNALMAILAQMGWCVPATRARIGLVDRVFSRVGAGDDLARGRSTFMAEMVETAAILNQSGPRALVILDEIGRGTATYDGLAIAWATAEHLHDVNGCRALFATHYHELTALADRLPHGGNACLRAKEWKGELVFLHEVAPGAADRSYGVEVARRAGLPKRAVARAKDVLARLEKEGDVAPRLDDLPLFGGVAGAEQNCSEGETEIDPLAQWVLDVLDDVDPDALTPRQALDLVYRLMTPDWPEDA